MPEPERAVALRANRDFRLLWLSGLFAVIGTQMTALALPLLVLRETGSAVQAGAIGTVSIASLLVTMLPGGVVADRVERRRLMRLCDLGSLTVVTALVVAVWNGHAPLALVLLVAAALRGDHQSLRPRRVRADARRRAEGPDGGGDGPAPGAYRHRPAGGPADRRGAVRRPSRAAVPRGGGRSGALHPVRRPGPHPLTPGGPPRARLQPPRADGRSGLPLAAALPADGAAGLRSRDELRLRGDELHRPVGLLRQRPVGGGRRPGRGLHLGGRARGGPAGTPAQAGAAYRAAGPRHLLALRGDGRARWRWYGCPWWPGCW